MLLGLQDFQGVDENNMESYYQISGIHGLPYKPWNGVASTSDWQETGGFGGYCTHSSILFAPWHRPYIALWEVSSLACLQPNPLMNHTNTPKQSLYTSVQKVAAKFPPGQLRDKYVAAAKDFRAPYWDWASVPPANTPAFPTALSAPNLTVTAPDGTTKSIANPLHSFTFHPMNPSPNDFPPRWSALPTTVRYPGASDQDTITPIIANELSSLANNVGLLLLSYKNFDAFSYSQWDPNTSPGQYGSLEDVHNRIHDVTGGRGRGHMSSLDVSSYDPLFWMHLINVDRLWAIWQELNPSSFMSPRPAPYSTFSTNGGAQGKISLHIHHVPLHVAAFDHGLEFAVVGRAVLYHGDAAGLAERVGPRLLLCVLGATAPAHEVDAFGRHGGMARGGQQTREQDCADTCVQHHFYALIVVFMSGAFECPPIGSSRCG